MGSQRENLIIDRVGRRTAADESRRRAGRNRGIRFMMLNDVMQEAINDQINNELFAMYSYMSMSAYCEHKQFRGCAHWMRVQSQEEHVHAMRLYNFLIARQGRVKLRP